MHALLFAGNNHDDAVEVGLGVALARHHFAFHHRVVGGVGVVVQRGGELLDPERSQEAVVDAFLERIGIHRLAEIGVGVGIGLALGGGRQAQLHRRRKVFQNIAPGAFIVGAAPVAFVDDDEIEKIRWVLAKIRRRLPVPGRAAHEGLENGKEDGPVLRHPALLLDVIGRNAHQGIFRKSGKSIERLIGQRVAVGQKQNARAARGLGPGLPVGQVPAAVKQLPRQLKRDKGLARAGCQRQQHAVAALGQRGQRALNGNILVIAPLKIAALVLKRNGGQAVAPDIFHRESGLPKRLRSGKSWQLALNARLHVNAVNPLAIGGIAKTDRELARVILGLAHAFGQLAQHRLGLNHGKLGVAVLQHIVGSQRRAALARTFEAAQRDGVLAPDAAALHHAPSGSGQQGIDQFGAGFGFVHGVFLQGAAEGLVQQGLLQRIEGGELALVEGFEALGFIGKVIER